MARPKHIEYTNRLFIRLTAADKIAIEMAATDSGFSVSEYVRRCSLSSSQSVVSATTEQEQLASFITQLNKIGVNLNQIARIANTIGEIDTQALDEALPILSVLLDKALLSWRD